MAYTVSWLRSGKVSLIRWDKKCLLGLGALHLKKKKNTVKEFCYWLDGWSNLKRKLFLRRLRDVFTFKHDVSPSTFLKHWSDSSPIRAQISICDTATWKLLRNIIYNTVQYTLFYAIHNPTLSNGIFLFAYCSTFFNKRYVDVN